MKERAPKFVIDAVKRGDTEILREAGRKGAEKTNARKEFEQAVKELEEETRAEKLLYDEADRLRSTNEDVLTSDGEDALDGDFYLIDD